MFNSQQFCVGDNEGTYFPGLSLEGVFYLSDLVRPSLPLLSFMDLITRKITENINLTQTHVV